MKAPPIAAKSTPVLEDTKGVLINKIRMAEKKIIKLFLNTILVFIEEANNPINIAVRAKSKPKTYLPRRK
jgi:hypothetical protein